MVRGINTDMRPDKHTVPDVYFKRIKEYPIGINKNTVTNVYVRTKLTKEIAPLFKPLTH